MWVLGMKDDDIIFSFFTTAIFRLITAACLTALLWNVVPATERVLTRWIEATHPTP